VIIIRKYIYVVHSPGRIRLVVVCVSQP